MIKPVKQAQQIIIIAIARLVEIMLQISFITLYIPNFSQNLFIMLNCSILLFYAASSINYLSQLSYAS